MLAIKSHTFSEPDSDNDVNVEATLIYENETSSDQEFLIADLQVFSDSGLLLHSSKDEYEERVSPAEKWETEFSSSYFKAFAGVKATHLEATLAGCSCTYKELGRYVLPNEGVTGQASEVALGADLFVQGVSVLVGKPDDDGDVTVELKVLVRNCSALYCPRVKIEGRILGANGRELDECSNYGDSINPSESKLLSTSCYLKKGRLNGASIEIRISIFAITQQNHCHAGH